MNKNDLKDGMKMITRDKSEYYYINNRMFYWKDKNRHEDYHVNELYHDDLTSTFDKGLDIMKIYYMDELIWERKIDWTKVPFGTKVRVWWEGNKTKQVGKFLAYDDDDEELPFFVFIEHIPDTNWYGFCEIIEEGEEE